jgi:hypothetical protein
MNTVRIHSPASLGNEDALPAIALFEGLLFPLHSSDVAVFGYLLFPLSDMLNISTIHILDLVFSFLYTY